MNGGWGWDASQPHPLASERANNESHIAIIANAPQASFGLLMIYARVGGADQDSRLRTDALKGAD